MDVELIKTADGSMTLLNKELNATYHSIHGAVQESRHIFIEQGLHFVLQHFGKDLKILEIGFGTGLNAWLSLHEAQRADLHLEYSALEKYPLPLSIAKQLNYVTVAEQTLFSKLHEAPWNHTTAITSHFILQKYEADATLFQLPEPEKFHLIYHDAFAPEVDPAMWEPELIEKLYKALLPGGCLVTFCAKGQLKRLLKQQGFKVEVLPGPPGKREMTRAIRINN